MVDFSMAEKQEHIEIIDDSDLETAARIRERLTCWNRQMSPEDLEKWIAARKQKYPQEFDERGRHMSEAETQARLAQKENLAALKPERVAAKPAKPRALTELKIPQGNVADLLEHQVAVCAALVRNVAEFVAGTETDPEICLPFMDRLSRLMSSSAKAGRAVGHLRGIATETKQTFVKRKVGEREGVPQ